MQCVLISLRKYGLRIICMWIPLIAGCRPQTASMSLVACIQPNTARQAGVDWCGGLGRVHRGVCTKPDASWCRLRMLSCNAAWFQPQRCWPPLFSPDASCWMLQCRGAIARQTLLKVLKTLGQGCRPQVEIWA
eukprot:354135-Chlamydomonas_euryale.AAC.9